MKILSICAYTWAIGGPARVIYDHTIVALTQGHQVDILSPASADDKIYTIPEGARVIVCQRSQPFAKILPEFSWELYRFLQKHIHEYDIVHCHGLFHFGSIAPFLVKNTVPKAITIHGVLDHWALQHGYWKKKIFSWVLQKRMLALARLVHVFNDDELNDVALYLGHKHPNTVVVPNGIDLSEFAVLPPRHSFRDKHKIDSNTPLVLFMGRLNIKKGLDLLLPAFQQVIKNNDAVLILAGPDDGYKTQTEAFIKENKLEKNIKMVGMLVGEDKKAALAAADVFVLPSYSEGFSIAVLEAMAAGVACLVSDRVGFDNKISQYQAAEEISLNVDAVAEGLKKLTTEANLRKTLAQNASKMLHELFEIKVVANKLLEAFEAVANKS
jgi:glycosyltransferase involved in cell wall biosynthesis